LLQGAIATIYCGGRPPPLECDGAEDGAGADEAGGLELDPDDELLFAFEEEFELEEEELEDAEEPDEPDPEDELDPDPEPECEDEPEAPPEMGEDDPELWSVYCEDPEFPALRVGPASGSPRWPFPAPSCFGGFSALGGGFVVGGYGWSGCFLW
jgi:hypothetical protein